MNHDVVIVSGIRTPFGKFGGTLKDFSTIELSSVVMNSVLKKAGISRQTVQEVNWGVCSQAEADEVLAPIIARQALLKAGLPDTTISMTIDQACCSGMAAVKHSFLSVRRGDVTASLGGGAEVMSRTPMVIRPLRWGNRLGDVVIRDPAYGLRYFDYNLVTLDAAEVALEYGISRAEQDEWAYRSQQKWLKAYKEKKFEDEIVPITTLQDNRVFAVDEFPRPDTTIEKLASLPTVFGSPSITAGNAPGLNDGAAVLLLMNRSEVEKRHLKSLATIICTASAATTPRHIASVPALAIKKALSQSKLSIDDMKLIEINEAFAAVPLVSSLILGGENRERILQIRERLNVNGGAIAIGHPVGASGARILLTLIHELRRRGGGYGVASICGGLAQAEAIIVKVDD